MSQEIQAHVKNDGLSEKDYIGKPFLNQTGKRIGRVIGMDPVNDQYISLTILLDKPLEVSDGKDADQRKGQVRQEPKPDAGS